MPAVNVYVDRELAEQIRRLEIPVSATCQAALRRKVRLRERQNAAVAMGRSSSQGARLERDGSGRGA